MYRVHIQHLRLAEIMVSPLRRVPFVKQPQKEPKRPCPWRTAFASLRFPHSGSAPWARRHGPSMAHRGSPGIHAGRPTPQNLLSASREGWQIKSTAPRGGRPAGLSGSEVCEPRTYPLWERACSRWHHRALHTSPYRLHRRQASSHKGAVQFQALTFAVATRLIERRECPSPQPSSRGEGAVQRKS